MGYARPGKTLRKHYMADIAYDPAAGTVVYSNVAEIKGARSINEAPEYNTPEMEDADGPVASIVTRGKNPVDIEVSKVLPSVVAKMQGLTRDSSTGVIGSGMVIATPWMAYGYEDIADDDSREVKWLLFGRFIPVPQGEKKIPAQPGQYELRPSKLRFEARNRPTDNQYDRWGDTGELPNGVTLDTFFTAAFLNSTLNTAPIFAYGYPQTGTITNATIPLKVKVDKTGTAYAMAVARGMQAPTAAQVKAGVAYGDVATVKAANAAVTANVEALVTPSTLTAATAYDIYIAVQDNSGTPVLQAAVTKIQASTIA